MWYFIVLEVLLIKMEADSSELSELPELSDWSEYDCTVFSPSATITIKPTTPTETIRATPQSDSINLYLTDLWICAPQFDADAQVTFGRLDTAENLFSTILEVLNAGKESRIHNPILKILIASSLNLGSKLESVAVIELHGDKELRRLRTDLADAWGEYRADTVMEKIICYATVYFEQDIPEE